MATYYFSVAFDASAQVDPQSDGTHYDAQYGFATDASGSLHPLGSSGTSGRQFETVTVPAAANGRPNQFVITLASNVTGIDTARSYIRCSFRPGHDVLPGANVPTSPLSVADAQSLLNGIYFSANTGTLTNITNGTDYGLPSASYSTQWLFSAFNLAGAQAGTNRRFEITFEVAIVGTGGTAYTYFKIDPEMMVDY